MQQPVTIGIDLEPDLLDALRAIAQRDNVSLEQLLESMVVSAALRRKADNKKSD